MLIKTLFLILLLFVLLCDGHNLKFYENESNLRPDEIITYTDNTAVFRLIKKLNKTCNEPRLMFRILYPNGTSNLIIIHDHNIPSYNFCTDYIDDSTIDYHYYPDNLILLKTIPNYILVIYKHFTNAFAMMIEWNGN